MHVDSPPPYGPYAPYPSPAPSPSPSPSPYPSGRRLSGSRPPYGYGYGPGAGAGGGGAKLGPDSRAESSEETQLLGQSQGLPSRQHHYYQSLPEITVVLADTDRGVGRGHSRDPLHSLLRDPKDSRDPWDRPTAPGDPHGRPWRDMSASLRRKDSLTARLGLESTNWCGIFLALLSGMFFTMSSAAVKALRSVDPMELLVIRSIVQVSVVLPVAWWSGVSVLGPRGFRWMLQLQGVVGALTLVLLFFSFRRLPLGDATTIIFSSPVFVLILSFLFLREPCGFFRTLVVCMLLTGVVLISKPPFIFQSASGPGAGPSHHYDVVGYACALLATLFTAANIVVMRKCKEVHFSVVVLQLSAWSLVISGTLLALLGKQLGDLRLPHGLWQWGLVAMVAAFGLSGQLLVARALNMEGAGKVAVTRSLDIVLAFAIQVLAFGEIPDWMSVSGAGLVLLCVLGMGLESQVHRAAARLP